MKDLIETARKLNNLKADFDYSINLSLPEPLHINKLIKTLKVKEDRINNELPEDTSALWQRFLRAFNSNSIAKMGMREKKKIPFLLETASRNNLNLYEQMLAIIQNMDSVQLLRREVFVYFKEYSESAYISALRSDIIKKLSKYDRHNSFLCSLKDNRCFFAETGIDWIRRQCVQQGVFKYLKSQNFPDSLNYSKYVGEIIKGIFDENFKEVTLAKKIEIFGSMYGILESAYTEQLPHIFANLIIQIDKSNINYKEAIKESIQDKALVFMGDPRLNGGKYNRWYIAGREAEEVFIRWISQYDLNAFFEVISRSLTDSDAIRMWRYREAFWKAYKDNIAMVWVCFGDNARRLAKKSDMSYGKFYGFGDGNKSCILIAIGEYIFVERSHNGKLKIWRRDNCPFKIGEPYISESKLNANSGMYHIVNGEPVYGWTHSSSETYNWQSKVGAIIAKYMHVYKTQKDWQP